MAQNGTYMAHEWHFQKDFSGGWHFPNDT